MVRPTTNVPREHLADLCGRHCIRKLSLFGSILRDDFGSDSDLDMLVEFEPVHVPGLALFRIQDEPPSLFGGRVVDPVIARSLNHRIRSGVPTQGRVQFACATRQDR